MIKPASYAVECTLLDPQTSPEECINGDERREHCQWKEECVNPSHKCNTFGEPCNKDDNCCGTCNEEFGFCLDDAPNIDHLTGEEKELI